MNTSPFLLQNIENVLNGNHSPVATVDADYFNEWWRSIPPFGVKYATYQHGSVLSFAIIGFDVLLDEAIVMHSIFVPVWGGQFENYLLFTTCDGFDLSGGEYGRYRERVLLPTELDAKMVEYERDIEIRYLRKLHDLNEDYDAVCDRTNAWIEEMTASFHNNPVNQGVIGG